MEPSDTLTFSNVEDYVSVVMVKTIVDQSLGNIKLENINIDLRPCEKGRFLNMNDKTEKLGITQRYMCPPKDFKIEMQGGFSSFTMKYISIIIDYCKQELLDLRFPG